MSPSSARITVSLLYASRNGVSHVDVLTVVLYAHSTLGSSSSHTPFTLIEPSLDNFKQGLVLDLNLLVGLTVGEGGVVALDS